MTPECEGCGAALRPQDRVCRVCGHRVGVLLSNVQAIEFAAQYKRRPGALKARVWRSAVLMVVLVLMLALALGVGIEASRPEAQPVAAAIGYTAQMVAQAAENQVARRSRTPAPGDPGSDRWRQAATGQLLALAVVAGGLILLVRSRIR